MARLSKYQTEEERKAAKAEQSKRRYEQKKAAKMGLNQSQNQSFSASNPNPLTGSLNEPTVLHAVDAGDAAPRSIGRNEKKYQTLLDNYLGPATGIIILILCLFVYGFEMEQSERIADHLAMNADEQDLIIPPLASLMDKQGWDEKTRNRVLQSGDFIGLGLGLASYGSRVLGTLRELKGSMQHEQSRQYAPQQAAQSGSQPGTNGHDAGIQWGNELAGFAQYAA